MKHKILICEDDVTLAKVMTEELTDAGFQVKHVSNGEDGVTEAQSYKPDLVLCDVLMPKMNGFEALEALKSSPVTKDIPVMMLTMLGQDDDIKKGLRLGANDYIVKSQHAVGEIVEKVCGFFGDEGHPEAKQKEEGETAPDMPESEKE